MTKGNHQSPFADLLVDSQKSTRVTWSHFDNGMVVGSSAKRALYLKSSRSSGEGQADLWRFVITLVTILNVQSQNIDPRILPKTLDGVRIPNRVDHCFALNEDNASVADTLRNLEKRQRNPKIRAGILTSPCTTRTPLLSDIEAFVQLSIFQSLILMKYRDWSREHNPPIPDLIIKGHEWRVNLSWFENEQFYINGPLRRAQAETSTLHFQHSTADPRDLAYNNDVYWPKPILTLPFRRDIEQLELFQLKI